MLICLFFATFSVAKAHSSEDKIQLKDRPLSELSKYTTPIPLYHFSGSEVVHFNLFTNELDRYKAIFPDLSDVKDIAFFYSYFTGGKQDRVILDQTITLVANYKAANPTLYVDYNGNLDFSDDGPGIRLNNSADIKLKNAVHASGETHYNIQKITYVDKANEKIVYESFKDGPESQGKEIVKPEYWFTENRLNILATDVKTQKDKFTIGLIDWNLNGLYNDVGIDKFTIAPYQSDTLNVLESKEGVQTLDDKNLFKIEDQVYEISSIMADGTSLNLKEGFGNNANIPKKLTKGDPIPGFKFRDTNNRDVELKDLLGKGKYTYLKFWATWCKKCRGEIPDLKQMMTDYKDQIQVVSLSCADSDAKVIEFVETQKMKWHTGYATMDLLSLLLVDGIPHGILIDEEGKIIKLKIETDEVATFLNSLAK